MRLLIFRDLQPWPGAQKALINQQHHRGEPGSMTLLGPSLLKDILRPLVSQEWLQSWRQGCWPWGWGKTEK